MEFRRGIVPFIPYILISIVHVVLIIFELPGRGFETKQLLMPALALAAIWSMWGVRPWPREAMLLILLGVTASWVGDGAGLFFPSLPTLPMMIVFFAIAHIAYTVLFLRAPGIKNARRVPKWALVYALWWVVTLVLVGPSSGNLLIPLAIYGILLGGTAALSTRFGTLVALGGVFFLISDTFLAFKEFVGIPSLLAHVTIMPTYLLGQGLIVYGTVALMKKAAAGAARTLPQ